MRPTGPRPAEDVDRRREPEAGRSYARRIDCDDDGFAAAPASPARGGGMREPSIWRVRRPDPDY